MVTRTALLFFFLVYNVVMADCCTKWDAALSDGGVYGRFQWLYTQPIVSDADLQYGTALTLTGPPLTVDETQNLTAHVQQIEPDYLSAYRLNIGYAFPYSNCDVDFGYFHLKASNHASVTSPVRNALTYQFLQNFLGGGYVSGEAKDTQRIDQADLLFGNRFVLDECIFFHFFYGLSFGYIKRDLDADFMDFVVPPLVNPIAATLTGSLGSKYWGIGPSIGTDFAFPIFSCLEVNGRLGVSALAGKISSRINSESVRAEDLFQEFHAHRSKFRIMPVVRTDLGITYSYPICQNCFALDFSAGYEIDYYFHSVDRVNPKDGYVNNPDSTPTTTTGSIGLGGPYAVIAIRTPSETWCNDNLTTIFSADYCRDCGFYFSVENDLLKPSPTNDDLEYGTLQRSNGSSKDLKVHPHYSWSGCWHIGYSSPCNYNVDLAYRYFQNAKGDHSSAGSGEGITSVNASGPAGVLFSDARSRVEYKLHQADLSVGKDMNVCDPLNLHSFVGLRYLRLDRTIHNSFTGGVPDTLTGTKSPVLRSEVWGIGPIMGIQPTVMLCNNMGITGLLDIAFAVGTSHSKLDQVNFGTVLQETSNTLRADGIRTMVPIIDTKIALFWKWNLCECVEVDLEVGYLFSDYFKGVNLVFPNFLTGLGQKNSSLCLSGPYVTLTIGGF